MSTAKPPPPGPEELRLTFPGGDIQAKLALGLTGADAICQPFASIEPELYRFPAIDAAAGAVRLANRYAATGERPSASSGVT